MAYADLEYGELEEKTKIGKSTLARMAARKGKPRGATIEQLWAIGDACEVPRAFMEFGWEVVADGSEGTTLSAGELLRRIIALEAQVRDLVTRDSRREVEEHGQTDAAPGQASRPQQPPPSEAPDEPAPSDEPEDDDGPHSHAA